MHAHFGLTAWPALAVDASHRVLTLHGNDLYHRRSRPITTAVLGRMDLVATPTAAFAAEVPGAGVTRDVAILPCGVDLERFRPVDRRAARGRLGLDPDGRYVLFPYDPARAVKRHDRALELVDGDARLLTLGAVAPDEVPDWVNAANAVVCPADWETFGLACIEALACDVPVLARPTGAHPEALRGIAGAHCGEWDLAEWRAALAPHLEADDPRVEGRDASADVLRRGARRTRRNRLALARRGGHRPAAILARRGAGSILPRRLALMTGLMQRIFRRRTPGSSRPGGAGAARPAAVGPVAPARGRQAPAVGPEGRRPRRAGPR